MNITLYAQWKKESNGCNFTFKDIEMNGAKDMIEEIAHRCIVKGYPEALSNANDTIEY
ncbi:hypothetical protein [Lysinibacillus xylanilyticus]|uniref:hypothetical protein n=1 Tax=Lysinibacillus xylanilyticus TaxID=582475 RepID=UPI003CFCCFF9